MQHFVPLCDYGHCAKTNPVTFLYINKVDKNIIDAPKIFFDTLSNCYFFNIAIALLDFSLLLSMLLLLFQLYS